MWILWLRSPTPDATYSAGRALGVALGIGLDAAGGAIALEGPLGAGKTLFVKGLAEGLGVAPELVSSPTFVIANEYPLVCGRVLAHVDLYRIQTLAELEDTGFLDWLGAGHVVVVEWADRQPDALPRDHLTVRFIREGAGDSQRLLNAIASGPGAQVLLARWRAALSADRSAGPQEIDAPTN